MKNFGYISGLIFLLCVPAAQAGWRPTGKDDLSCQTYRFECMPELGHMTITRGETSCSWGAESAIPEPDPALAKALAEKYNIFYPKFYNHETVKQSGFPVRKHSCTLGDNTFEVAMDLVPNWAHPTYQCMYHLYFLRANISLNGQKVVDNLAFALPCKEGQIDPQGWPIQELKIVNFNDSSGLSIQASTYSWQENNTKDFSFYLNEKNPPITNQMIHGQNVDKKLLYNQPYKE